MDSTVRVKVNQSVVGIDRKIPLVEKIIFPGLSGIGTFYGMMVNTWLLFFYTDILKINTTYVGSMIFGIRIIAAILAPAFGMYIDSRKSHLGRYKPWLTATFIGSSIAGFFTFMPISFGTVGNMIYATITFCIFSIFSAIGQAPGAGLAVSVTKRQDDRITLGMISYIWSVSLAIIASAFALPLINLLGHGNQGTGFRNLMLLAMIISLLYCTIFAKVVKERFVFEIEAGNKSKFKALFHTIIHNKYVVINLILSCYISITGTLKSTVGIYYYKYYFNDANLVVTMGFITIFPMFLGLFLSSSVTKKIGVKSSVLMMVIITLITSALIFFVPATNSGKIAFIVLSFIGSIFSGIAQPAMGTLSPAAIDYGEWKLGKNCGGLIGSFGGFVQILSGAVAGGMIAWILVYIGYTPDVAQTASSLSGIKFMMSLLPAILCIAGFIILKWDLSEEMHREIIVELNTRRIMEEK